MSSAKRRLPRLTPDPGTKTLNPEFRRSKLEQKGTVPPSRANHSAAAWGGRIVVFGGKVKRYIGGMASTGMGFGLVAESMGGGAANPYGADNSLHVADVQQDAAVWSKVTERGGLPPARQGHTAVAFPDAVGGLGVRMVVYGGSDGSSMLGDVWGVSLTPPEQVLRAFHVHRRSGCLFLNHLFTPPQHTFSSSSSPQSSPRVSALL